ncbi:MAG: hypothetical protein FWC26_13335 [Fibromonadales bacterium]|nr:hypothetical protein [Fibromonadales bacterium]
MTAISDVLIINVSKKIPYRNTKHCVCISVAKGKCLFINTQNRKIYDEIKINSSDYEFLNGVDRYVACSQIFEFSEDEIVQRVGDIKYGDMLKIIENIRKAKEISKIERNSIISELEKWLENYAGNKLSDSFNSR